MTTTHSVTFLGAGAMGAALARATLGAGRPVTVWNRNRARAEALAGDGATVAASVGDAVDSGGVIVACLLDAASVHDVLDPVADRLDGRRLVNLTTTSPQGAREIAAWAAGHGVDYLDGGVMAVPEMIGTPASLVYYSGSRALFDDEGPLLQTWGRTEYFGDDAGLASLHDLALLSTMYLMFAGFFHGAALAGTAGMPAKEFAARTTAWLQALLPSLAEYAEVIDGGDYTVAGQQSLEFSDLSDLVDASRGAGIGSDLVDALQGLIRRQIDAGHGAEGFARVVESIRRPAA